MCPCMQTSVQRSNRVVPFRSVIYDRSQTFQVREQSDKVLMNTLVAKKNGKEGSKSSVRCSVAWCDRIKFSRWQTLTTKTESPDTQLTAVFTAVHVGSTDAYNKTETSRRG